MEPLRQLPADWSNRNICLKMSGGIGDVLMAIGGTARTLKEYDCNVTAAVRSFQKPLMRMLEGIDDVIEVQSLNTPINRQKYDVLISFDGVFNTLRQLKKGDYYTLVSQLIGVDVGPGKFKIEVVKRTQPTIALHPGGSNPNRRWAEERWQWLCWEIRNRRYKILWLGTKADFGFRGDGVCKLSDFDESLEYQILQLSSCHYFIGNDSGFCHIAGMLEIPGTVIFLNTCPEDVIARYSLKGVWLGEEPSRSLRIDDPQSARMRERITVDDVLRVTGLSAIGCTNVTRKEELAMRTSVLVVGVGSEAHFIGEGLEKYYDVEVAHSMPQDGTKYDALIEVDDEAHVRVRGADARVNTHNIENVHRAIQELLHRED